MFLSSIVTLTSSSIFLYSFRRYSNRSNVYIRFADLDVASKNTFRPPRFVRFVKSVLWHTRRAAPAMLEDASIRFANGFAEAPVAFWRARESGPARLKKSMNGGGDPEPWNEGDLMKERKCLQRPKRDRERERERGKKKRERERESEGKGGKERCTENT